MDEERTGDVTEYLALLGRRKGRIILVGGALLLSALALAFALPPVYRSEATILIEEQEVPTDLVRSTVTSYADQRIQTIKHQVMTRSNLWKIVEQYGLYAGLRWRKTTEEILHRMVDDIGLEVISADVVDRRTGQPTRATIAFTLSYDGETPDLAQKVANELTSLFLAENLKSRQRSAEETTTFLKQESDNLNQHIGQLEKEIARFKQRAGGALPELTQLNLQFINQTDQELLRVEQEIRSMDDRRIYLEGQLATLKPNTPMVTAAGERVPDADERLKILRTQYVAGAAHLSPKHPDMIKMKREIEALEKESASAGADDYFKQLTAERTQLATLLKQYGEDHPDVIRTRKVIAALEVQLNEAQSPSSNPEPAVKPENPAYITIQAQLASTVAELEALKATQARLKTKHQDYVDRVERTTLNEREYQDLLRDRDNSVTKYDEIRSKLLEARVSEGLELQRKGEQFSLIDPPALPQKPVKPNRVAIVVLGLIFSMMGGVGYGVAADKLDHSVRNPRRLEEIVQAPTLAVIPFISNMDDQRRLARKKWVALGAATGLMVVLGLAIHLFWMPLDVIWWMAARRLGML
jgi:uncharacterized protein involved in exopolysaccharide biosynthesis